MHRPLLLLAPVFVALLVACGPSSRSTAEEPRAGASEQPTVEGWPPVPEVETTAALQMAELAAALPALPAADGARWAEDTFVPWMAQREEAVRAAAELRRVARRGPTLDQAVVAGLHGAILQHTHDSLRAARVERIDPEAAEALTGTLQTLADKARGAYEVCHQLSLDAGTALDGWRLACDEHLARLP